MKQISKIRTIKDRYECRCEHICGGNHERAIGNDSERNAESAGASDYSQHDFGKRYDNGQNMIINKKARNALLMNVKKVFI